MKLYTKGGDKGETQVFADKVIRRSKDAIELECYGTLDELNSHVGMLSSMVAPREEYPILEAIQNNLFQIGFAVSANTKLQHQDVNYLEQEIDRLQQLVPQQTGFILPGGCATSSQAHICRTIARRAERRLVALASKHTVPEICLMYINRLSDYFFILARYENHKANITEPSVL